MPRIEKSALSQYLRTRCYRFLYLSLFQKEPSESILLPLSGRPGVMPFRERGKEFESRKMDELHTLFGDRCLHVSKAVKQQRKLNPDAFFKAQLVNATEAPRYWLEPTLTANSFAVTLLHRLGIAAANYPDLSDLRPDVVELLDADRLRANGPIHCLDAAGTIAEWNPADGRQPLRVMDMKVSEHLNTSYAAEVVLYSLVLAAWLEQQQLLDRFVVLATPAVWVQGVHRTLLLPKVTDPLAVRVDWVNRQLEAADAQLYAPLVLKFLIEDVPKVLEHPTDWRSALDWGVAPICSQCDWLGYPAWSKRALTQVKGKAAKLGWRHEPSLEDYCYSEALRGQLAMQIPQLTTGMRRTLTEAKITTLPDLAARDPEDRAFQQHHGLRLHAPRLPGKSQAILAGQAQLRPGFRTAQMAQYADLRLTISVNFDAASDMLISLGLGIDYREPTARDTPADALANLLKRTQVISFFIERQDPALEREQLFDFLGTISRTLEWIRDPAAYSDEMGEATRRARAKYTWEHATVQVCFWDERQAQALREAIGRHLHYLSGQDVLRAAIWLFPPEEVVGSDRTAATPPLFYLKQVVTGLAVLPTTINDDLISVAETLIEFDSRLSDFQWDRIGGTIPKERALEIWQQLPPKNPPMSLSQCRQRYEQVTTTLVQAMRQLVRFLTDQHRDALHARAPKVQELEPTQFTRVAPDALLWLAHLGFEEGVQRLETRVAMTLEPHELEARFLALRTLGCLPTAQATAFLQEQGLKTLTERYVFRVRPDSRHVKFRNETSFLALLPEQPPGAGLMSIRHYLAAVGAREPDYTQPHWQDAAYLPLQMLLDADLVHFDRNRLLAVVDLNSRRQPLRQDLVRCGALNFETPFLLVEREGVPTFRQIKDVAQHIGNPDNALPAPETAQALVKLNRQPGRNRPRRVARLLWEPQRMVAAPTPVALTGLETLLEPIQSQLDYPLNDDQLATVRHILGHVLSLVWGGPGTGKTRTLVIAIIADILLRLRAGVTPIRVLVTTLTYRALEEIVERLAELWERLPAGLQEELTAVQAGHVTFLASTGRGRIFTRFLSRNRYCGLPAALSEGRRKNGLIGNNPATVTYGDLRQRLYTLTGRRLELVFAVTRQAYLLGKGGGKPDDPEPDPVTGLFDRIWIDESSQLAVSQSLPALALLAEEGALALFGDRLQMPPIQATPPPRNAEYLVGSLHTYLFERIRRTEAQDGGAACYSERFLRINYRSCEPIVAFSRQIGYREEFEAAFPERRLAHPALPSGFPDWDTTVVPLTPVYEAILDPERPCVAVTYDDGRNGQANRFEAALVAGTVLSHRASCCRQAAYDGSRFDEKAFWTEVIGIVTPHRAQRAAVVNLLQQALLPADMPANLIDDAVDTVERFQGSERELILISFGLGDPDLIQREEEFLFQKERINVAITRARAKVVLFVTRDLAYHLPESPMIIEASKAIKNFVYRHARHEDPAVAVTVDNRQLDIRVRYRGFTD
ncbi:MAG: AAA domain-containing protein [Candidatus Competibacteraceae bacterium]